MLIRKHIEEEKLFNYLAQRLKKSNLFDPALDNQVAAYLVNYASYNNLSWMNLERSYKHFIETFNDDVKAFKQTNKFPLQLHTEERQMSREDYDIILLLSVLLTTHRHRIMSLIKNIDSYFQNVLVIGCGPGLEMELIKGKAKVITAYDLKISEFIKKQHADVILKEAYFDGNAPEKADAILLIEILEHLEDPYQLLMNCMKILSDEGKIFLTTATNIPQFDHRFNFEEEDGQFEELLTKMGLKILYREEIKHNYITVNIDAKNTFYELIKA